MAVTREQFVGWLKAMGGSDVKARQDAERRLAMLPRAFILEHLPPLWEEAERSRRQSQQIARALICLYVALFLFFPLAKFVLHIKGLPFPSPALMMFIGPIMSALFSRKAEATGMLYVLVQHQYPELVPLAIEALSVARKDNSGMMTTCIRDVEVMGVLTKLLPRYAAMDRPGLSEKQHRILRNQLRQYSKKLRSPYADLTDTESAFLSAILAFLHRERAPDRPEKIDKTVESLALERVDAAHERREHRQVREAARQAIVRLYG